MDHTGSYELTRLDEQGIPHVRRGKVRHHLAQAGGRLVESGARRGIPTRHRLPRRRPRRRPPPRSPERGRRESAAAAAQTA
jgi:hypothetical protein